METTVNGIGIKEDSERSVSWTDSSQKVLTMQQSWSKPYPTNIDHYKRSITQSINRQGIAHRV
ncbi:hypothetical protein DFA_08001 [Cavenderia fasciculata]|uniref:Uncharacterized protein n=1 Tax=Cavenderia fasciculata TaxID=261658 RepID=F4Q4L1_CACFS|nr:uncharacterized protein DFA_08001 [Cavenderia fasciculata]EGG17020.1 hypothetical protein DFA_08001 [Cavenderia fasciculata]|eukprot:XP_004355504.1 hypothetical protein DFA_08001 [Cavenderia fasciculata]